MDEAQFFAAGKSLGVPDNRLKMYLRAAREIPDLAWLAVLKHENNNERNYQMPNSYGQLSEKELHFKSLEASAEIAERASLLSLEKGWEYERAVEYLQKTQPELFEMQKCGYVSDREAKSYSMTSYQASEKLARKTKKLMREKHLSYEEANTIVCQAEENQELLRAYTHGE